MIADLWFDLRLFVAAILDARDEDREMDHHNTETTTGATA